MGGLYEYVCIFCRVLVMIYETQRVAAKKRHLFKCEWTGSSSAQLRSLTASHSFHLNAHMAQHMAPVSRATRRPLWALDNRMCGAFLGASCCLFRSHLLGSCTRQVTNFLLIPFFAFFSCLAAVANLPGEARRDGGMHMDPSGDNSCCFCVDFEVASSWRYSALLPQTS